MRVWQGAFALVLAFACGAPVTASAQEDMGGGGEPSPVAPRFGGPTALDTPDIPPPDKAVVPGDDGLEVETLIIQGRHSERTIIFDSPGSASGLQYNTPQLDAATRARVIARENLEAGEVGAADQVLVHPKQKVKTTIRVDEVIVQTRSKKSKACVQVGVVGRDTECGDAPQR